jgi:hypothetical protein
MMNAHFRAEGAVTSPAPQREPPPEDPAPGLERIEPSFDLGELDLLNLPGRAPAQSDSSDHAPLSVGELELELDGEAAGALDFVDAHDRGSLELTVPAAGGAKPEVPPVASSDVSISDLYAVGDFTGALQMASSRLAENSEDAVAQRYVDACTTVLLKMYGARLGALQRRPQVEVAPDQIRWLSIDHRAGFLLSLIDGQAPLEDILDMSGMPRLDAMRIMVELVAQRVISLRD